MKDFWQKLPKGFVCLAPMEGVTDTVFRRVLLRAGAPDVSFTEFTSMDGLFSRGEAFVKHRLQFDEVEKPLIAQIWGMKPENYLLGAQKMVDMGFDGIDINMGCPEKNVVKKGGCSALVLNKPLAKEIVLATIEGAAGRLPVSVKIRIGFKEVETEVWAEFLLGLGIDALTVHGRTTKQMSKVPADWNEIGKVVQLRNRLGLVTPIIGNGDVESLAEAKEKVARYGVDGVMIGRGIFHNPWLFADRTGVEKAERLALLEYHVHLWEETWQTGDGHFAKSFNELKRFFKIYVQEFYGASELRVALMEARSPADVYRCLAGEK